MLTKIEHIALAVSDLEQAISLYRDVWGLELQHREIVSDQGVEEAMFMVGDSYVQLLAPLSADSTVGRFIERKGEGLHHIAYEVDDITEELKRLHESGTRLIDEKPRRGSRGSKVAFIHPSANRGVLVELVELPRSGTEVVASHP
ncbi:MAG: methylmalonyl-CoA epimerase [Actinomycetota bacterium]